MNVSKVKMIFKYMTGGFEGIVEYLLDLFNDMIQRLPKDEVAKYAQLAKDIAVFVDNIATALIKNEAKKLAAKATAQCFADLATALLDSELTEDELDCIIESVKAAIKAWQEAK